MALPFLDDLAARRRFGMKPGLETISALCHALGDPQRKVRAVHVAGTNGKGAVCAMLEAMLRGLGFRTGRYTSPHLMTLNERFFLDGAPLGDAALEEAAEAVQCAAGEGEVTFFEALTAVAFSVYARSAPDFTLLETGLGGRLDATNICSPVLTVITRIGLDHCDYLGDTVEKIAAEKAGIIKPGVPIVLGRNADSVRTVIAARANALGAPFVYAPEVADEAEIPADFSLAGAFNRENAVTALAALKTLRGERTLPASARSGLARVVWPGRFQRIGRFIVDGAHNPPAAQALAAALSSEGFGEKSLSLIAGFCGDKDVGTVLRMLAPFVRRAFAVRTNNPRSLSAEETAARMGAVGMEAMPCASLEAALTAAKKREERTLVCGSLFLAGEALVALGAYPWGAAPRLDPSERIGFSSRPGSR